MNRQGYSTRTLYDDCADKLYARDTVTPASYVFYDGKNENCNSCVSEGRVFPQHPEMVDIESELRNITRQTSRCPENKYNPQCKKSGQCISTYEPSRPRVFAPELCPIVHNNIKKADGPGFTNPEMGCSK